MYLESEMLKSLPTTTRQYFLKISYQKCLHLITYHYSCIQMFADTVTFLPVGCSQAQNARTYFHTPIYNNCQVLPPQLYPALSQALCAGHPVPKYRLRTATVRLILLLIKWHFRALKSLDNLKISSRLNRGGSCSL